MNMTVESLGVYIYTQEASNLNVICITEPELKKNE